MIEINRRILKGRFEGHFKTNQRAFLTSDEPFPPGNEHKVQIYRGIVSNTHQISSEELNEYNGYFNFNDVKNVQVNASNHWSVTNDRIFTFEKMKLSNVKFSNVQTLGDETLGEISGDIAAEVKGSSELNPENNSKDPSPLPPPFRTGENPDPDNTGKEQTHIGNKDEQGQNQSGGGNGGNGGNGGTGSSRKGCFNLGLDLSWLRWLLLGLLILLLLYLLGRCTQIGRKMYCKIDDWRIENERQNIKEELDTLRDKIEKTTYQVEQCGSGGKADGKNFLYEKVFNLGTNDGLVTITFNAKLLPDRMEVIYDGEIVDVSNTQTFEPYESDDFLELKKIGFTQYESELSYRYTYKKDRPTELMIRVIPNKDYESTEWDFQLNCPQ
jgi:hypothetical protein